MKFILLILLQFSFVPLAHSFGQVSTGVQGGFTAADSYRSVSQRTQGFLGQSCERSRNEYLCMMCNCIREATGEPLEGKKMVGLVVKSRVEDSKWPGDICSVIYQPHQFSWTMEDRGLRALPSTMTKDMMECAAATDATINAPGNGVDHYHAYYVNPRWARTCEYVKTIKAHKFYKNCGSRVPRHSRGRGSYIKKTKGEK